MNFDRRQFLELASMAASLQFFLQSARAGSTVGNVDTKTWRGFNLPDRIHFDTAAFSEADFDIIAYFGFNFVRLPLDYRIWTNFAPDVCENNLRQLETVISWGASRGIHVNVALVRAPGYSVAGPIDDLNLWGDGENGDLARAMFIDQWSKLARRFATFPPHVLSFNLVNEPPAMKRERYLGVISPTSESIHAIDPTRLIVADTFGIAGTAAKTTLPELRPLKDIESVHSYFPTSITDYGSRWFDNLHTLPLPVWPTKNTLCGFLSSPAKPETHAPIVIKGSILNNKVVTIRLDIVNNSAHIIARADGVVVYDNQFFAGPRGKGTYKSSIPMGAANGGYYQSFFDTELAIQLPLNTKTFSLELVGGDWITFSEITISAPNAPHIQKIVIPVSTYEWLKNPEFTLTETGELIPDVGPQRYDANFIQSTLQPFQALQTAGVNVHIGEFGVNNRTPHDVTIAWLKDNLEAFKKFEFGWALWELRGTWGILDSQRADVRYDDYAGHKLDRKMLELLQSY